MMAGLRWVPEDTVLTVHRFGRYVRTLTPGLRFTLPLVDQVAHRVRLVGHQLEVPLAGEDAARADVYYQIRSPSAPAAHWKMSMPWSSAMSSRPCRSWVVPRTLITARVWRCTCMI